VRVGVLALQGGFQAHVDALEELGAGTLEVRTAADLDGVDALVLPGGESSAMLHLMVRERLDREITTRVGSGMPVLATCAGVILLATRVEPAQPSLRLLDVVVERNAYGRQVHSSVAAIGVNGALGEPAAMEAVFIRAPRIRDLGAGVKVLGRLGEDPVLIASEAIIAATFHPELSADRRVHRLFLGMLDGGSA
jgi:5'-phosphate synthase pdxT subunit